MPTDARTVVFDLGGVLIDWDPRLLYRTLLADDAAVEAFLAEVEFAEWNHAQDAGRPFTEAVEEAARRFPHRRELLAAYPVRFADTLVGPIEGSVEVLRELRDRGVRLLALTNWSAETFPYALERFAFLGWFEDIVVSGAERIAKPDPRIFALLVERFGLDPAGTVFIDDAARNVDAAAALGFDALHFRDAAGLRDELTRRGLLDGVRPAAP